MCYIISKSGDLATVKVMVLTQNRRLSFILILLVIGNLAWGLIFGFQQGFLGNWMRLGSLLAVFLVFLAERWQPGVRKMTFPILLSWIGIIGLVVAMPYRTSIDSAMYLDLGSRILAGEVPYVDFIEINPPTIYYLSAAVVWVSRIVQVHPTIVFQFVVSLLIALISYICTNLLRLAFPDRQQFPHRLFTLVLSFSGVLFLLANGYGQREHIFVLLFLPWILLRWNRWQGNQVKGGWAVGLACAVAVTLKPHFLLFPLGMEIYWILEHRSLRKLISIEWLVVILCAFFFGAGLFLPESIRQGILNDLLPMVRSGGYAAYGSLSALIMILIVSARATPVIALLAWIPGLINDKKTTSLLRTFSIFTLISILVFVQQGKGWDYHFIPAMTGSLVIILALYHIHTTGGNDDLSVPGRKNWLNIIPLLLIIPLLTFVPVKKVSGFLPWEQEVSESLLAYTQEGDPVLVVTNMLDPYRATNMHGRTNVPTYHVAYPVAFEYYGSAYDAEIRLEGFALRYLDTLQQDILNKKPIVILVENSNLCVACPVGFSYTAFLADVGFTSTIIEPDYTQIDGDMEYFDTWVRTESLLDQ